MTSQPSSGSGASNPSGGTQQTLLGWTERYGLATVLSVILVAALLFHEYSAVQDELGYLQRIESQQEHIILIEQQQLDILRILSQQSPRQP